MERAERGRAFGSDGSRSDLNFATAAWIGDSERVKIAHQGEYIVFDDPASPGMTMKMRLILNSTGNKGLMLLRIDAETNQWAEVEGMLDRQ